MVAAVMVKLRRERGVVGHGYDDALVGYDEE